MFNRYVLASLTLSALALVACSAPATSPAPTRTLPVEVFPSTDPTLALRCDRKFQRIREARLFPGGTWELTVAKESGGGEEVIYYQQADNEVCAVRNRDQSCAAWKQEHGWSPCEEMAR